MYCWDLEDRRKEIRERREWIVTHGERELFSSDGRECKKRKGTSRNFSLAITEEVTEKEKVRQQEFFKLLPNFPRKQLFLDGSD